VYAVTSNITEYFDLKEQNKILLEQNNMLLKYQANTNTSISQNPLDSILSKKL
jgi:hypothetical protein